MWHDCHRHEHGPTGAGANRRRLQGTRSKPACPRRTPRHGRRVLVRTEGVSRGHAASQHVPGGGYASAGGCFCEPKASPGDTQQASMSPAEATPRPAGASANRRRLQGTRSKPACPRRRLRLGRRVLLRTEGVSRGHAASQHVPWGIFRLAGPRTRGLFTGGAVEAARGRTAGETTDLPLSPSMEVFVLVLNREVLASVAWERSGDGFGCGAADRQERQVVGARVGFEKAVHLVSARGEQIGQRSRRGAA